MLPATLAPPAPFPLVVAQSMSSEFVAPGVRRGTYRLQTSDGPLVIDIVAVDPREPTVRIGAVLAHDRLISPGETVGSMAKRTGAVAGINADYFDIGNTNQPLNIVVRGGTLVRTPSTRIVFDVRRDRSIHFESVAYAGALHDGATTYPLTSINEWPPQGGVALLDEAYGTVKPVPGIDVLDIVPVDPVHSPLDPAGAFRVAAIEDTSHAWTVHGYQLAFGPAALAIAQPPVVGDAVTIDIATTPPLDDLVDAVGGGPALVAQGSAIDDPNAPAPEERDRRFPVAGAATLPDGTLLLISVDGRAVAHSIGLTRPQFAALALGFGATGAMAFDSGGSADLVARVLGDAEPSVLGSPSDGEERAVADGVFVYSDAPVGLPTRLVIRPRAIVALPGSVVPVRAFLVDAGGHALGTTHVAGGDVVHVGVRSRVVTMNAGALHADVAVDVVDRLARLVLAADVRHPEPGEVVRFHANGYDARGREVVVGPSLVLHGPHGPIDRAVPYRLGVRDERFDASAAGATTRLFLRVGHRTLPLDAFGVGREAAWRFAAAPTNAPGTLSFANDPPELRLAFDFTHDERAAYAQVAAFALPGEPLAISIDVAGDASGVALRASFVNGLGETRALTLASHVDWRGWRLKTLVLPDDVSPPVRLASLYAVPGVGGGAPSHTAGTIAFRNLSVTIAGRP